MKNFYSGFDYLRVLATFSVVWIHAADNSSFLSGINPINIYAVPCFILMSIFLTTASLSRGSSALGVGYLRRRCERLGFPLLAWSAVYLLARSLKGGGLSLDELNVGVVTILTGGASYQLWFLPALLIYQFIVWALIRKLPVVNMKRYPILMGLLLVSALLPFIDLITAKESLFGANLLNNLQFVCLAVLSFFVLDDRSSSRAFIRLGAVLLLLVTAVAWWWNRELFLLTFSFFVFYSFLVFEYPSLTIISFVSKHSFGIYLIHGLFIEGGQFFFGRIGFDLSGAGISLVFLVGVFVLSLVASAGLSRFSLVRRWHILG
jgi:surface polysaccharide O-acyltransferase-like enzyme